MSDFTAAKPRFRMFFTPIGAAFLIIVFVILIRSLSLRNSYEMFLSAAALLLFLILGITGAWKARKLASLEPGWKPPSPMTANAGENWLVTGIDLPISLFFRLHFIVRGRFYPSGAGFAGKGCPVLAETSAMRGETAAELPLDFPMSGILQADCFCRLRDVFGLYSFSCGVTQNKTVKIRSSPCYAKNLHINPQSGAEDKRNKQSSDEERYYMREYTPGDRFRDINWKSSEKIDALITRISPENQEKISRIDVYLRNFGPADKPSLEALWLLDRAKARLSHFLRSLMEEHSSFIFHVHAIFGGAPRSWELENIDDLETFLDDLAGLSFSSPQYDVMPFAGRATAGDLYVFSTICDKALQNFILACNPRPVSLFFATFALPPTDIKPETLRKRDFPIKGCYPAPPLLFGKKLQPLGAKADKVTMIYAETRL